MTRITDVFFSLVLLIVTGTAAAQTKNTYADTVAKHAALYGKQQSAPVLFLHVDKTIYVNKETIWFAAYLLNPGKNFLSHNIISVSLINNITQNVVAESKFPLRGFAHGNLMVPDTIAPGHYSLVAISNLTLKGKPVVRFLQPLTIKSVAPSTYSVALTLDTLYKDASTARVLLTTSNGTKAIEGATVNYYLGKDKNTRIVGEAKTNVLGSYTILIPKSHINGNQHKLAVQVKFDRKIIKTINIDIPVKKLLTDVKFYPEGGYMVAGLTNRISWEAKTPGGAPLKAAANIYENDKLISTVLTDSYGLGKFELNPVAGKTYSARLSNIKSDSVYVLPAVLPAGLALHIDNSVVNDTLVLNLKSSFANTFTILVHNYKTLFSSIQIPVAKAGHDIKISLASVPRGLNTITVLDGMKRPLAEHLFFAHHNQKQSIAVKADVAEPDLRQKINLKLKMNGLNVKNGRALVSVAVAQDNRFEVKKENNIEHYFYLQSELDRFQIGDNLMGQGENEKKYLNDLLLVRGWSRYNWPEMLKSAEADTAKQFDNLYVSGDVTRLGKPPVAPISLTLLKDSSDMAIIKTDEKGHFALSSQNLFVKKTDNRLRLTAAQNPADYKINLTDPYLESQGAIARAFEPEIFDPPVNKDTKEFVYKTPEKATNLREVKIKAANDKTLRGSNACGDYVCRYDVLNCFNHPNADDNRQPIIGERVKDASTGDLVTYLGCEYGGALKPGMVIFKGVYNSKEYYGANYTEINSVEPNYISTLFWKHDLMLTGDEEVNLSFYTSDITGKFRVVVQGVTNEDVIYGETTFEVKEKTKKTP